MSLGYGRVAAIGPRTGEHGLSCACTDCETGKALVEYKSVLTLNSATQLLRSYSAFNGTAVTESSRE